MRSARKLALLAVSAVAAMAFMASSAMATPIWVVNEATGAPCGNVSLSDHTVVGGCTVHATGTGIELEADIFGFHVHEDTCDNEYMLTFDATGNGFVHGFRIFNCEAGVVPCNAELEEKHLGRPFNPWPANGTETAPETVTTTISVCIITGTGECEGNFVVPIVESGADGAETYTSTVSGARIGSSACEIDGTWTMEGTEKVHVNHVH